MKNEICLHCANEFKLTDMLQTDDGDYVCEDCANERCERCLLGDCEVETAKGEVICSNCYSGSIDHAYDMEYDKEYA
jgi:hypothetical protein